MLLTALSIATIPRARASCTNASFKGVYGILSAGLTNSGEPKTSIGQFTTDGDGNLMGWSTQSTDGAFTTFSFTGSYSVAKNCTGTVTLSNGYTANLVLDNGNKGAYMIQTNSGYTQSSIAVAEGTATCTDAGVKHTFAVNANGNVLGIGEVVYVGQLTLNGSGNITGTLSTSLNGAITSNEPITTGTYSIDSNCIGTASITLENSTMMNFDLIVVDGGKELMALESDSGTVVSGLAQE
jgi:hypothetical protein